LLLFVESEVFRRAWKRCGLSDDDLLGLQQLVAVDPNRHPVMEGTGGVRKMRFSPARTNVGKSGSHRVCFVYYAEFGVILLLTVYPKSKKDNISAAGRETMRKMVEHQLRLLQQGNFHE
jgi:hypothetical protein